MGPSHASRPGRDELVQPEPREARPHEPAQAALRLQRTIGNRALSRLVREQSQAGQEVVAEPVMKSEATLGGLSGLTLNVTFSVTESKAKTLQCIQAWWGSGNAIGVKVGKHPMKIGDKDYESFIDGGKNSPWVTLSGNDPAHPTQPYYLTADEQSKQVTWDKDHGTIRIYDLPGASAKFEEMFFETAIVAVDVDGKGTDKILRAFTWGNSKQGSKQQHEHGDKIEDKDSHIVQKGSVSATFLEILKADYPDYKFT